MRVVCHRGRAAFEVDGSIHYVDELSGGALAGDPSTILADGRWGELRTLFEGCEFGSGPPVPHDELGAPVPRPGTIFGIGVNYAEHAKTANIAAGSLPTVFVKFPSSVVGPRESIVIPPGRTDVDWEAELAFVIGTPARRVPAERALEHVAGVTVAQDITERDVQFNAGGRQFGLGKGYDTFCPLGPALVTLDELAPLSELSIRATLNGEPVQDGSAGDMILDVAAITESLSQVTTLRPGDVVLTGTPAGTGFTRNPPRFLSPGDELVTEIPGIGELRNPVVAERAS